MDVDLNQLNAIGSAPGRPTTLQFAVAANSFFPILVFNGLLRGPEPGSMALIPTGVNASSYSLPATLRASLKQLVIQKLPSGEGFDFAVRDGKTGSPFSISTEASTTTTQRRSPLASPADGCWSPKSSRSPLGVRLTVRRSRGARISIGATMQPVEITQLDANGDVKSATLPPLQVPLPRNGSPAPT